MTIRSQQLISNVPRIVIFCLSLLCLLSCFDRATSSARSQEGDKNIGRSGVVVLLQPLSESAPVRNAGLFVGVRVPNSAIVVFRSAKERPFAERKATK